MKISEANRLRMLYFLVFCCTASWLPILADHLTRQGLNGIEVSMIMSVTPLVAFLVQPFYGVLADRMGYKKCLLFFSIMSAISFACYLLHGGFVYLFVITICMSLFYSTIQPLLDSLALKLTQNNPAFSYGTLRIAGAAGWAFTGIIVGYFIDKIDTSVIFIFSSVSLVLTFIFSFSLKDDDKKITTAESQSFKNVGDVFGNRILIFLLISVALISTGATTIWNFYSIYMKENGASAALVGYGISLQGLCELPLFYFSARIINKFGIKNTLLITVFVTTLRLFLYSAVKNPNAAIFIELLHGISWSLFWVVCVEYVNKLVREDWRATGQSLLYAAYYGVGQIAGNFWTGYLYDTKMRIAEIFLLNAGIVGVVGLFIWIFMRQSAILSRG